MCLHATAILRRWRMYPSCETVSQAPEKKDIPPATSQKVRKDYCQAIEKVIKRRRLDRQNKLDNSEIMINQ
jgi:hypothetical protein